MLDCKIRRALSILERFKDWQHKYVCFSGGKDSLVCLDLCAKVWKDAFKVVYIEVSGNTHPKCNKYVEKICNEYGVELIHLKYDRDFFDMLETLGYPSVFWVKSRWCMQKFKDRPMRNFTKINHLTVTVARVKQGDSHRRKIWISKNVIDGIVQKPRNYSWGLVQVHPIYNWKKDDVWIYIHENNLPINPLYKEIGGAGNCLICPAMRKSEFVAIKVKCPEVFNRWKKAHEKLRKDFEKGKLKGMRVVFHQFDKWYRLYCLNKSLSGWR